MKMQKAQLNVISSVPTMSFFFFVFFFFTHTTEKTFQLLSLLAETDTGPGLVTTTMLWHTTQPFSQLGPMNCQALSSWRERSFDYGSQHLASDLRPDGYLMGIVVE